MMQERALGERGTFATLFAILLPAIVGFLALGLEVADLFRQQRQLERAADAAVIAGMAGSKSDSARAVDARVLAASYGLDTAAGSFAFNKPPLQGSKKGVSTAGEVVLTRTITPQLMRLLRSGTISISARAVAQPTMQSNGCILLLEPSAAGAIVLENGASIANSDCEVVANSSSATAMQLKNNSLVSGPVYLVGNYQLAATARLTGTPITTGGAVMSNPYLSQTLPTKPGCSTTQSGDITTKGGPKTLSPDAFCSGITVANNATLNLNPGVYFIDQRFNVGQNAKVNGTNGVTLIFGTSVTVVQFQAGAILDLVAPTSGTTSGLVMIGTASAVSVVAENGSQLQILGAFYMPSAQVVFSGNANTGNSRCTQFIAKTLAIGGALTFRGQCDNIGTKPIGRVRPTLVE